MKIVEQTDNESHLSCKNLRVLTSLFYMGTQMNYKQARDEN